MWHRFALAFFCSWMHSRGPKCQKVQSYTSLPPAAPAGSLSSSRLSQLSPPAQPASIHQKAPLLSLAPPGFFLPPFVFFPPYQRLEALSGPARVADCLWSCPALAQGLCSLGFTSSFGHGTPLGRWLLWCDTQDFTGQGSLS